MTPDDMAEQTVSALARYGGLEPHAFLTGEGAPAGAPFVLVRPEGTDEVWALRIEGPMDRSTPEGIAAAAVQLGFAVDDRPGRPEFRPCDDCCTPISCEEGEVDRCP